jgi:hypothetical protein
MSGVHVPEQKSKELEMQSMAKETSDPASPPGKLSNVKNDMQFEEVHEFGNKQEVKVIP